MIATSLKSRPKVVQARISSNQVCFCTDSPNSRTVAEFQAGSIGDGSTRRKQEVCQPSRYLSFKSISCQCAVVHIPAEASLLEKGIVQNPLYQRVEVHVLAEARFLVQIVLKYFLCQCGRGVPYLLWQANALPSANDSLLHGDVFFQGYGVVSIRNALPSANERIVC